MAIMKMALVIAAPNAFVTPTTEENDAPSDARKLMIRCAVVVANAMKMPNVSAMLDMS